MSSIYSNSKGGSDQINYSSIKNNEIGLGSTDRVLPRQVSTGSLRGTQNVGYGNVKIDGSNNRITIGDSTTNSLIVLGDQDPNDPSDLSFGLSITGSNGTSLLLGTQSNTNDQSFGLRITDKNGTTMTIGIQVDGTLGFRFTDSSGFVLFDSDGLRWNWNDKTYGTNQIAIGKLLDNSYNIAIAATGENVNDAIS